MLHWQASGEEHHAGYALVLAALDSPHPRSMPLLMVSSLCAIAPSGGAIGAAHVTLAWHPAI